MHVQIKYLCSECDEPDPKVVTIYTREQFCGRQCLAEGQLKYTRMILRAAAEGIDNGGLAI